MGVTVRYRPVVVGLDRIDMHRELRIHEDHGGAVPHDTPKPPADPGPAHAVRIPAFMMPKDVRFLDAWARALCGARVKVLLPIQFDGRDPDACPRCATAF